MDKSEHINELATALSKAQAEMQPVAKDAKNPMLKNRYATLDAIIEATRKPLTDNGLAITQLLDGEDLTTMLMHSSGQWIASTSAISKMAGNRGVNDAQVLGGSLTYMKRYALAAMLGISTDEDTDGNTPRKQAQRHKPDVVRKAEQALEKGAAHWLADNDTRKRFWAKAKSEFGLDHDKVHMACGVTSMKDYTGTAAEAWAALEAFAAGLNEETAPFE